MIIKRLSASQFLSTACCRKDGRCPKSSIMKAFVALGLLLLLLVPLLWMCSGQEPVLVECSHFNFRAIAKRELFYKDEFVGPDELFLGTGCRAINVRDCELEFNYPVSLCGITMQLEGLLQVKPVMNLLTLGQKELDNFSIYVSPDDAEMNPILIQPSPVQQWFLVQYRSCVFCGYPHLRDNWSKLFYETRNHSIPRPPSSLL
ncbi:oocyte-secreted protein 3-like [Castor canadensis]|uniref:Oocyte-secreted protein 3-like n=1 Tax=Castor canadensis TaxID=51338 RepID=A0AC58LRD0_CASCN